LCNGLVMIRGLTRSEGEVSPPPSVLKIGMRPYLTTIKNILIQHKKIGTPTPPTPFRMHYDVAKRFCSSKSFMHERMRSENPHRRGLNIITNIFFKLATESVLNV
jgi:hypothetical protein